MRLAGPTPTRTRVSASRWQQAFSPRPSRSGLPAISCSSWRTCTSWIVWGAGAQLLESLCREAPPNLHLVLASRWEPPFAVDRLRGRGQVLEIGAAELAFSAAEVAALLPLESERLAADLHTATEGWPAAVRLAIESLRAVPPHDRAAALARLRRSSGPLYSYLAAEVLEREAPETQELLRFVSALGRFTPDLLAALGVPDASRAIGSLARRGLFLELRRPEAEWYAPTGLLREFVLVHTPLDRTSLERLHRGAAAWLEDHGHLEDALRSLRAIEDHAAVARLLTDRGRALLRTGVLETVVEAAEAVPAPLRTSALEEVEGAARQIRGAGAPA